MISKIWQLDCRDYLDAARGGDSAWKETLVIDPNNLVN